MFGNVFYQTHLSVIGGVETFLYELARLADTNKRDLTIIYGSGDRHQIERIRKHCRIYSWNEVPKPVKCKKAFFNYGLEHIDDIEAEEYIQIVHADFKDPSLKNYPPTVNPKITKRYAVSQNNAKSWEELTGEKLDVIYNPIQLDKEPRIMTLVSAQRLTSEKGGKRLERMVRELDSANIPYVWHIFSNTTLTVNSPNIMYHEPTLDVRRWLKYADFMVLLSDTEGYPYTAYESLCLGTPLIITRLPILSELGCTDENSIVLDFDMSNLDVDAIYKRAGNMKFTYTKKPDKWTELLPGKSDYKYVPPKTVRIVAIATYFDVVLNKWVTRNEQYDTTYDRADKIVSSGYARYL